MSEMIKPQRFHEIDWRVVRDEAATHFRTESFAVGVVLVDAIGKVADAANHHPDVDLRYHGVTVHLSMRSERGLTERDLALAREISDAARALGVPVDLDGLQALQVSIDALVIPDVLPFWRAVLGYDVDDEDLLDPHMVGTPFTFQQMDAPRPQRNRIHIDLYVPQDQAEARVAAAIAAGGHVVSDEHAPGWWTLADSEGNEVDVAPWPDRD